MPRRPLAGRGESARWARSPIPASGYPWDPWARYEAAINHAYAEFPLWNLCLYDRRITSSTVLDDVASTHPHLTGADGAHLVNPHYEDPAQFLARRPPTDADPLEAAPPTVDIIDPTSAAARNAAHNLARTTLLHPIRVEDLVMAVSETVRNVRAAAAVLSFDPLRQVGSVRGVRPAAGAAASDHRRCGRGASSLVC